MKYCRSKMVLMLLPLMAIATLLTLAYISHENYNSVATYNDNSIDEDYILIQDEYEEDWSDPESLFAGRKRRVDAYCAARATSDPFVAGSAALSAVHSAISSFGYFAVRGGGVSAVCAAHKTGSNSWAEFMRRMAETDMAEEQEEDQDNEEDDESAMEPPVNLKCWPGCAKNLTKVIVVRHPLQRLLSAWRYVFDREGDPGPRFGLSKMLSWPDFVDKLLENPADDAEWQLAKKAAGDHWEPLWRSCSVCSRELRPDLILRLETLETRDLPAYLQLVGLPSHLSSQLPHLVVGRGQVLGATQGNQVESAFYGRLSRDKVRGLFQYYRPDHELFGYSPNRFLQYANAKES